ncbi:MAG: CusA/CzcA family heavy metal efflux RND transporter [Flavobacteriales bacterium]|nr:CusA/CzcA family heavy metal efflux RND transporter [Flavobacteriales bacterium]
MLSRIIHFSIKNKFIVAILTVTLLVYGIYETSRLPIDAVPDITNNQVQVITVASALGAGDIERLITFPIEQGLQGTPEIKELRSFSRFGLSVVTVVFEDNINIYWARQQISERLQQMSHEIPKEFGTPFLAPVSTGLGEIYQYTVRPKKGYEQKYNAMDLRTIQDWIIKRQLLGVEGVAEVSSFGGRLKQYEIVIDPAKLKSYQVSVSEIFSALEKNNQNIGGSYIEKGPIVLFIRTEGLAKSNQDIEQMVVKMLPGGIPLHISDVAKVEIGNATRFGAMTYNGTQEVSGAVVMMLKDANSNTVIKNIKKRIKEIRKTLPEGIEIDPFLDRSKMVNNAIGTVSKNLIEGALIVIFVLVLFLGNVRAGLLVASVIPLSMLFAIILMNIFGISGNLMSLGAIDFGLIVDGAVIIVEAVVHRFSKLNSSEMYASMPQSRMDEEVKHTSSRMMNSAVFGQIIIVLVYLPIFSMKGIEGKMFKPMAQTVAFALLGAFVLSLTYVPMMSAWILGKQRTSKNNLSDRIMGKVETAYHKQLLRSFRNKYVVISSVLVLLVITLFLSTRLGGEFIPNLPEGDFAVETRVLTGSNINTSVDGASKASKLLLSKFPEIEKIVTKTGTSEVPTDPMPLDASDMVIVLKDRKDWTSASSYADLEAKMIEVLDEIPGVTFGFQYPVAMRFNELISGARQDVVCKIFGENMDTLEHYAQKFGAICKSVKGSSGVYVEAVAGMPQIVISYNRQIISQYGLAIEDINSMVNAAFAGRNCGVIYEGEKRFDLVVKLEKSQRSDVSDVQNLLIETPNGNHVPLSLLADVQVSSGYNQIQRENSQRRIVVGFNVRGKDVQSVVQEMQQKVEKQIKLPPGYFITYGGAFENLEAAKSRLSIATPIVLFVVFLMLYFAFGSLKQSLLIYTAIPLSAIGGVLALVVRGLPFSISAGIGFIALFGVAVLNGIVLISEFNRHKQLGFINNNRIAITASKLRLRPVLMTAFVASLGFIPMALSTGEGAEVQRPLATVVIGGLLVSTFLTLFVLPILYSSVEKSWRPKVKKSASVLLLLFAVASTQAQSPISLKQAIDTAIKNNNFLKIERLKQEYNHQMIATKRTLSPTQFSVEAGQINSFYFDKNVGVSQNFALPNVYLAKGRWLTAEWESSVLQTKVEEKILAKNVSAVYFELVYLIEKQKTLIRLDSMFSKLVDVTRQRFEAGDCDAIEKALAENQSAKMNLQLLNISQSIHFLKSQFQLLLNSETKFELTDKMPQRAAFNNSDSLSVYGHPEMQWYEQQLKTAELNTQNERLKMQPELSLGYNLMSMQGYGSNNQLYDSKMQFQSVQVGVGVPIFASGQRTQIKAAVLNEKIVEQQFVAKQNQMMVELQQAFWNYQNSEEQLAKYERNFNNNFDKIIDLSQKQLKEGGIRYVEWIWQMNEALNIELEFLELQKNRNQAIVELNYLIEK